MVLRRCGLKAIFINPVLSVATTGAFGAGSMAVVRGLTGDIATQGGFCSLATADQAAACGAPLPAAASPVAAVGVAEQLDATDPSAAQQALAPTSVAPGLLVRRTRPVRLVSCQIYSSGNAGVM
jgi:hypothetical protein